MMKKWSIAVTLVLLLVMMVACGNTSSSTSSDRPEQGSAVQEAALVVYFSRTGNTAAVAEEIREQIGADAFEIVPVEAYSEDYDTVTAVAQEEQNNNARPEIRDRIDNLDQYDTVYVGYPIWWGDMPMILYTFFDTYDLSGKTVRPFCTSGGSGLSQTVEAIRDLEPDATVTEGLHIRDAEDNQMPSEVTAWLTDSSV